MVAPVRSYGMVWCSGQLGRWVADEAVKALGIGTLLS